jgi:hypothetical protein
MERGWREGGHTENIEENSRGGEQEIAVFSCAILRQGERGDAERAADEIFSKFRYAAVIRSGNRNDFRRRVALLCVAEIGTIFDGELRFFA